MKYRVSLALSFGVFFIGVLPLISSADWFGTQTFRVEPHVISLVVPIGSRATSSFIVTPDVGNFEYGEPYWINVPWTEDDHCLVWQEDEWGDRVCKDYDYDAWAEDQFLCDYLDFTSEDGSIWDGSLMLPDDPSDVITVGLVDICLSDVCGEGSTSARPFPRALLGRELSCTVSVEAPPMPVLLPVHTAYAAPIDSTVEIRVTVVEPSANPTLVGLVAPQFASGSLVGSTGPDLKKGVAEKDVFTFGVVYTDAGNAAPASIAVAYGSSVSEQPHLLSLHLDEQAPPDLRDGDFRNGEFYVATSTFPKGKYFFSVHATSTAGATASFRTADPVFEENALTFQTGYSSVIFLPGIQGSQLVEERGLLPDDQLWFPTFESMIGFDDDVRKLRMHDDGSSVLENIFVNGVFEYVGVPAFAGDDVEVYRPFTRFGEQMSTTGMIRDFVSFPYDWRYDVRDVVGGRIQLRDGFTYSMPERLAEVGSISDSGKVVVIGHSNGGLVGKALISKLAEQGVEDLVEKFVMVGVPQLGTPKAITSLLHGYGQGIEGWLFLDPVHAGVARLASQSMPGAYGLLPLGSYAVDTPSVISFDSSVFAAIYRDTYGSMIDSQSELQTFLVGGEGRAEPEEDSLNEPVILSPSILNKAVATRQFLETWDAPASVDVIEFAGTNVPTISTLEYKAKEGCIAARSECLVIDPKPAGTGDGTVILQSAQAFSGAQSYVIDMLGPSPYAHADILNIPAVQGMLRSLIATTTPTLEADIYPKGTNFPVKKYKVIQLFSPVAIEVTDTQGNRIKREKVPNSGVEIVVENIPGGQYHSIGEMQTVVLPAEEEYTIHLTGTATGTLQLEIEEYTGPELTAERIHGSIPVTPTLTSTFTLAQVNDLGIICIDTDGNGSDDVFLAPQDKRLILQELRAYIVTLKTLPLPKLLLLAQVAKIENDLKKGRITVALKTIQAMKLTVYIDLRFHILTREQKRVIAQYLADLEKVITQ